MSQTIPAAVKKTTSGNVVLLLFFTMQSTCCPLVSQDMRGDGVPPNLINFNLAVKALGKGGDWERATRILGDMKSGGVNPDERTFSAAIEVL